MADARHCVVVETYCDKNVTIGEDDGAIEYNVDCTVPDLEGGNNNNAGGTKIIGGILMFLVIAFMLSCMCKCGKKTNQQEDPNDEYNI